jgi:hypothetical protein
MTMPTETARPGNVGPEAGAAPARHRSLPSRRRGLYWVGVLVALAALVGGGIIVVTAWTSESAPETAALAYFRALERGDAPAALGLGDVPAGVHSYLTSDVLQLSSNVAKIDNVHVLSVDRSGRTAKVTLQYQLIYPGEVVAVTDTVDTVQRGHRWRLTRTAVPVHVRVGAGASRMSVGGTPVPNRTVLFFPGALPISVDTPNLELDRVVVHLNGASPKPLEPRVSSAGTNAVAKAVAAAVNECLRNRADTSCPTADDPITVVPGSVRGTVDAAGVAEHLKIQLDPNPNGLLRITGTVKVNGSFQILDFDNQPVHKTGPVQLAVSASCYASDPSNIVWTSTP